MMAYTSKQTARDTQAAEESAAKQTTPAFNDQRASTSVQLKQQQMMNAAQSTTLQRAEDEELLQGKFETAQLAEEEELLQGKFETAQLAEDEELLQGKFSNSTTAQLEEKPNNTGLPNQLKAGIESLSGMSMDGVKVHYNSDKPAQLNAHAYAQGTDIHVAPGQEQHLPHEAWHVVQQAQGRVQPTTQMKGTSVNDDVGLETEADVMGAKALNRMTDISQALASESSPQTQLLSNESSPIQRFADYYAWGAANTTPHVHVYNSGMHLKSAGGHRYNIVANGAKAAAADDGLAQVQGKGNKKLRQTIKHTARDTFHIDL